jgi:hypothetical protein
MFQPVSPLSLAADSRLSDDVLLVQALSVDPHALGGAVVVAAGDGSLSLFAILAKGGACELLPSTTSASGYDVVPLPKGTGASEVISFLDSGGNVHVFYATAVGVLHVWRDSGTATWNGPDTMAASSGLTATQVPLTREWVVSGVGSDGNLVLYRSESGSWSAATVDVSRDLVGGNARVQYMASGNWVLFTAAGGQLKIWTGEGSTVSSGPETVSVANPVARVLFTYLHANSAMVVFTDSKDNLYSSVGFSDTPACIPLGQVVQGTGVVGFDGYLQIYGTDVNGKLWVLHQTGWDSDGTPVWAPIFPIDVDVTFVAAAALVNASTALLVTRADGTLDLLNQQTEDGLWNRVPVQGGGSGVPFRSPRYRTRLALTDVNGMPCPNMAVTVSPSDLVALEVAGKTVITSPGQPATLITDMTGTVDFSQPATGLDSATFMATASGVPSPVSITPYDYLHVALAGSGSIFTGSTTIPQMNATTLQQATVDGQPLAPGITSDMATAAAQGIQQAMRMTTGDGSALAGFEIDLRDPRKPRFAAFETADDLRGRVADLTMTATALDSAWGDIAKFANDVWNGIKSGAMNVTHWVVDTANMTVSATVQIAENTFAELKDLALAGVGEIVSLVHGVFNAIKADLATVLNWLKDLFDWDSIWNTMEAFNGYLVGGLQSLSQWLEQSAVIATGHFFKDLKNNVDRMFAQAISGLGNQPLYPANQLTEVDTAATPKLPVQFPGSAAQNNWLLSKVSSHMPGTSWFSGLESGLSDDLFTQIQQAISKSGITQDGQHALAALQEFFSNLFSDPRNLGQVLVADLLTVAQDLIDVILDAVDTLVTILLDLADDIIQAATNILEAPLPDIPVLTWLWDNMMRPSDSSEPMTLGKLSCLVLAVPVTLACKLETGHGPSTYSECLHIPTYSRTTETMTLPRLSTTAPWRWPGSTSSMTQPRRSARTSRTRDS